MNITQLLPCDILNNQAKTIYTAYCNAVGGVAFNGDPLPDWEKFSSDQSKEKQAKAWDAAAAAAFAAAFTPESVCLWMLVYAVFSKWTGDSTSAQIKERLIPFFGEEMVEKCIKALRSLNCDISD